jgi:hypothetical protein
VPKFRKKPVVREAEQYDGPSSVGMNEPLPHAPAGVVWFAFDNSGERYPVVKTAGGQRVRIKPGDWVLAEPNGRGHYPCDPDIFAAEYEPVEE